MYRARSGMIDALRALAPPEIAVAGGATIGPPPFDAADMARVTRARAKRRHEFLWGRVQARHVLGVLGARGPVGRAPSGAPMWPAGICGSISHAPGMAVAAAAPIERFAAIGIDLETEGPLAPHLVPRVVSDSDRVDGLDAGRAAKAIFCIKEAVYKAAGPGADLHGFHDVRVDVADGTIRVWLARAPGRTAFEGRFGSVGTCAVALVWRRARPKPSPSPEESTPVATGP